MSVRPNLLLIRSSPPARATKASTTAVIASGPPNRSYSVGICASLNRLVGMMLMLRRWHGVDRHSVHVAGWRPTPDGVRARP